MVEQALALGDAEGLEALTMRRLAQELGVTTMALYWHFRNKDELLAGLAERIWSEIDTDIDPGADWPQQLRGLLESLVRVLRSHPCASQLLLAGEKDAVLSPATVRRAGELLPSARVEVVTGAPHSMYWETPALFNDAVASFLKDVASA